MGSPNTNRAYLASGRLAYGCTSLATAWPHGGTGLGLCGSAYFAPPSGYVRVPKEEDGHSEKVIYVGGDAVLGCSLEDWDKDALVALFRNTTVAGGEAFLEWPGNEGVEVPALTDLVFTPRNSDHPGLIIRSAVPLLEESARLQLSSYRWLNVPLLFLGKPRSSDGDVAVMGKFSGLAL